MKKYLLLGGILVSFSVTTISCKKKYNNEQQYTCSYDLTYQPFSLAFTNIPITDLDTIIIHKFLDDGSFDHPFSIDTIMHRNYQIENGMVLDFTNYIDGQYAPTGIGKFSSNTAYKVFLRDINQVITITNIKESNKNYSYQSSTPCATIDFPIYFGMPVATFESPYSINLAWQYTEKQGSVLAIVK